MQKYHKFTNNKANFIKKILNEEMNLMLVNNLQVIYRWKNKVVTYINHVQ